MSVAADRLIFALKPGSFCASASSEHLQLTVDPSAVKLKGHTHARTHTHTHTHWANKRPYLSCCGVFSLYMWVCVCACRVWSANIVLLCQKSYCVLNPSPLSKHFLHPSLSASPPSPGLFLFYTSSSSAITLVFTTVFI